MPPTTPFQSLPHRPLRATAASLAWAGMLIAVPALAAERLPEPRLQLSHDAATGGWKGLTDKPSADPRADWYRLLNRDEEARQIDELLQRVGNMEKLTAETRRSVEAIPAAGAKPPPAPSATVADDPEGMPLLAYGATAALALAAIAVLVRRRRGGRPGPSPAPAAVATAPRVEPVATPAPKPAPMATSSAPPAPSEIAESTPVKAAVVTAPPPPKASPTVPGSIEFTPPSATAPSASPVGTGTDQSLELAEIMLSMGLANGAAQTLVEHIHANPQEALLHWLKLLEIYRTSGHRHEFKEAAEELRQHFNIRAEDWTSVGNGRRPSLEEFPRIATHLDEIWKDPAATIDYLRHLLEDNREGTREGFPQPVAEEIMLLIAIQRDHIANG